ncbi:MAG: DUF3108 domain-containing protein [Cyclobacteriaceae bacterium]|nr:DUF3108 domain-containing protein [Cyclobacteriaceae bacterium]
MIDYHQIAPVRFLSRCFFNHWQKIIFLVFPIILGLSARQDSYRKIKQDCLSRGEQIEYRVHYGFINAGEAIMKTDKAIHTVNARPCYKVDVYGNTVGFFDMITHVRDNWGTYIDTSALVSQRFYQSIQEGKYLKKEVIQFDQLGHNAIVHRLNKHDSTLIKKDTIATLPHMQDLVSGYYYMRTFDFSKMNVDEIFTVSGFFDDTTYQIQVKFLGREKIKTKIGEVNSFVVSPIMPKNSFFRGKNPIRAWISDDKNRIPLKVKAELLIGALEIDIRSYKR